MNSPIKEIIQWFSRTFTKLSRKMAEAILTSLHNDTVDIDKLVDSLWIKLGLGKAFEEHVKQAIKKSYDIGWGEKTITLLPNLQNAWDSSGMNLSAKLHGADAEMREAIVSVITQQLKLNTHCLTAARALYDGYNADKVTRRQTIPKYLAKVVEFSRRADLTRLERETLQAKVRKTRRQVERLAQGGAPNKALKSTYMELLDACEHGTEKALNRAVHNACEEKSRYIAERIARTESARAWADGFVERYGNDEDVVAYRWKLSSRHPRFDICNLYAEANLWGLGKGIYPKDKTPNLPVHPHCLCHLAPVFSSELEGKTAANQIEAGGRQYIEGLNRESKKKLLGVTGYEQIKDGASWTTLARNYSSDKLGRRISKSDSERSIIKAEVKATGIKCQKVNYPPRKIDVANLIFDDNHVNIERAHHVTESMAKVMIEKAIISLQRWNGKCEIYCSLDGWVYVMDGKVIRTVFKPEEYDENVKKVQEVLKNHEDKMPNNR
ncbi:MAG: hypothetical protein K6F01_12670 [Selenomonas sp.]|uniref:hypothetical protein n=1 Tax=Selenomonas sp. TaxID=2053611 RepID=UPI0025FC7CE8|nr:hypothetical protein [Selenomonas sp.]MCR5440269.1 hypothetical protein [Selenomonas sp.]